MSSPVTICNSALIHAGDELIVSLTEDNKRARFCNHQYPIVRDELLESHYWNFAMARADLAELPGNPVFGFNKAFQLPADCLRVKSTHEVNARFKIEGRTLLTNLDTVSILYISNLTDEANFSRVFREALATRLASVIAFGLSQKVSLSQELYRKHLQYLKDARSIDGQEGDQDDLQADVWLDSRLVGPGRVGNVEV